MSYQTGPYHSMTRLQQAPDQPDSSHQFMSVPPEGSGAYSPRAESQSRPSSQGWMTSSPAASETDSASSGVSSSGPGQFKRCEALYDYTTGLEQNNIPMIAGDQFHVIEEDSEGWTRVRRVMPTASGLDEGYVPSAYLKMQ